MRMFFKRFLARSTQRQSKGAIWEDHRRRALRKAIDVRTQYFDSLELTL